MDGWIDVMMDGWTWLNESDGRTHASGAHTSFPAQYLPTHTNILRHLRLRYRLLAHALAGAMHRQLGLDVAGHVYAVSG